MNKRFEPGDEVWVKATVIGTPDENGGISISQKFSDNSTHYSSARIEDIRKAPPSEQSETAELERKVVEGARRWRRLTPDEGLNGNAECALAECVDTFEKAIALPSLEQECVKAAARAYCEAKFNYSHSDLTFNETHRQRDAESTEDDIWVRPVVEAILALVKARE